MSENKTMLSRSDVPVEQTWNLDSIFPDDEAWEAAYKELEAMIPEVAKFQGKLAEGPEVLVAYFKAAEKAARLGMRVVMLPMLSSAVDSTDQTALARSGQARSLFSKFAAATSFDDPELMVIGFERLGEWMQVTPELAVYEHYFERLEKRQPHIRSSEIEKMLAMAGDPLGTAQTAYSMLTQADMKFEPATDEDGAEHEVGQSTITGLVTSRDRALRRTAFASYADGYTAFKNTLSATLTGVFKRDVFNMRSRGYDSSLHASMAPNLIPTEVFHNLIDTFKKNLPTWHRYWGIRKKALGYDEMHWYDTVAPITTDAPVVSFESAVEMIAEGMKPLGEEYVAILRRGCLEERWVDWAVNKGKRAGAFSAGSHDTLPYIMMSWADDLFSLSTLAHELGHSMHSYYSRKTQPFVYSNYSLFVAEVASNFNQAMVRSHLFAAHDDPKFQIALIDEAMSNFRRYFFIMPTLARFELEVHERVERGAPVNADSLIALCADLFEEGFGEHLVFDRDRMGIMWAQFGHMYANFYVYKYATGIAGAHALADGVLKGEDGAVDRYLDFLRAGGSVYPLDALKTAGVDLTQPGPVDAAFETLSGIVDRLETLV